VKLSFRAPRGNSQKDAWPSVLGCAPDMWTRPVRLHDQDLRLAATVSDVIAPAPQASDRPAPFSLPLLSVVTTQTGTTPAAHFFARASTRGCGRLRPPKAATASGALDSLRRCAVPARITINETWNRHWEAM
jgi:hypothetical protein